MASILDTVVVGLGIDVIEVTRIAQAMEDPSFVSHVLTETELRANATPEWLSGRWAAKEAVAKAVGVQLGWHDVLILDDEAGRPRVQIQPGKEQGCLRVSLTIAVGGGVACAVAIAEAIRAPIAPVE